MTGGGGSAYRSKEGKPAAEPNFRTRELRTGGVTGPSDE